MRAPGYWQHESSGVLAPVVKRYLGHESLTLREIGLLRAYFRQWIESSVWDQNPHGGAGVLSALRSAVIEISSQEDIDHWLESAEKFGTDPL